MAQRYFSNFPLVNYNDSAVRNIVLKSQLFKSIIATAGAFYTYVVRDGERADTIAFDYYGHSDYSWLVYFSNSIVDPYFDWPMTDLQINDFIVKKYGDIPTAQSQVAYYYYDTTSQLATSDSEYQYNLNYRMETDTYNYMSNTNNQVTFTSSLWLPKYAYDYELEKNDDKRNINLINNTYLNQINREISNIFKK
jgi:hypothetical protein